MVDSRSGGDPRDSEQSIRLSASKFSCKSPKLFVTKSFNGFVTWLDLRSSISLPTFSPNYLPYLLHLQQ